MHACLRHSCSKHCIKYSELWSLPRSAMRSAHCEDSHRRLTHYTWESPAQCAQPSAQPCASCGTSRRGLTRLLEPADDTLFPRSLSNDNLFRLSCNTTKIRQRKGLQFVQEIYHITDIRELSPTKTVCSTFIKGVTQPSVTFLGQGPSLLI